MNRKVEKLDDLERIKEKGLKLIYPDKTKIAVGTATCGLACGAGEVLEAITREVREKNLPMMVTRTGCLGFCQREPLVDVLRPCLLYTSPSPRDRQRSRMPSSA